MISKEGLETTSFNSEADVTEGAKMRKVNVVRKKKSTGLLPSGRGGIVEKGQKKDFERGATTSKQEKNASNSILIRGGFESRKREKRPEKRSKRTGHTHAQGKRSLRSTGEKDL